MASRHPSGIFSGCSKKHAHRWVSIPYRLHDLRHSFNTNMSKAGVKDAVVMKLTGLKTLAMFLRYSHLDSEQGEHAIQQLNDYLHGDDRGGEPKKEEQET